MTKCGLQYYNIYNDLQHTSYLSIGHPLLSEIVYFHCAPLRCFAMLLRINFYFHQSHRKHLKPGGMTLQGPLFSQKIKGHFLKIRAFLCLLQNLGCMCLKCPWFLQL